MPKSTSQITVGANGSIHVASAGTAAPSDIATPWAAGWVDLGYANNDGVKFTDAKTTERIDVWQLFYPARHIVTARDTKASFVLRQWSKDTVKLAFGGGTITTTAGPPAHYLYLPPDPGSLDERAIGIEWIDGTKVYRLVLPRVLVTESVETNLVKTGAADLPITVGVMGVDGASPWSLRTNDPAFA
jgi:hypothetical protein